MLGSFVSMARALPAKPPPWCLAQWFWNLLYFIVYWIHPTVNILFNCQLMFSFISVCCYFFLYCFFLIAHFIDLCLVFIISFFLLSVVCFVIIFLYSLAVLHGDTKSERSAHWLVAFLITDSHTVSAHQCLSCILWGMISYIIFCIHP